MKGLSTRWENLRSSYWFLPTVMVSVSLALAPATLWIDRRAGPEGFIRTSEWLWGGGPDGARELLAVIGVSLLSVTGVVFSVMVVALQLASTQFGPRVLSAFMRDAGNQFTLGTFLSTFVYSLVVLRSIHGEEFGGFVPDLSITVAFVMTLGALFVLIYFINHLAQSIRAERICATIGIDFHRGIDRFYPEDLGEGPPRGEPSRAERDLEEVVRRSGASVRAGTEGYVQSLDEDALLELAESEDAIILLRTRPGKFVATGREIARIWPPDRLAGTMGPEVLSSAMIVGAHRTLIQDLEFSIHELTEVAIRSLSPSLHDPFTAMLCIDRLGAGYQRILGRRIPSRFRYRERRLRVIADSIDLSFALDAGFKTILPYTREYPSVLVRLLETVETLASHVRRPEDWKALARHAERIGGVAETAATIPADQEEVRERRVRARDALRSAEPGMTTTDPSDLQPEA